MKMRILVEFTGYPDGTEKSRTVFRPGVVEVPGAYADLLVQKGLAEEVGPEAVKPAIGTAPAK